MPTYFMSPYNPTTWDAAVEHLDNRQTAFAEGQMWVAKKNVQVGDIFLCYIIGEKEIVAALSATSLPHPAARDGVLPLMMFQVRIDTDVIARVPRGQGVSLAEIKDRSAQPRTWISIVQGALKRVPPDDARWIIAKLKRIARTST